MSDPQRRDEGLTLRWVQMQRYAYLMDSSTMPITMTRERYAEFLELAERALTPDETRECPVKPQELREIGRWIEHHSEHGWLLDFRRAKAENARLDALADWLEQPSEQPAVPSSTQPQDLLLSERMRNWDKHNQPSGASNYADEVADLKRRNAELLEHLKICVQRLYVHQGATTRKIVADAQSVIDAARGKESLSNDEKYTKQCEAGGCESCGHGAQYAVVFDIGGPDEMQESSTYEDEDFADDLVGMLNTAYSRGLATEQARSAELLALLNEARDWMMGDGLAFDIKQRIDKLTRGKGL